jgi:hypothetical protein
MKLHAIGIDLGKTVFHLAVSGGYFCLLRLVQEWM